MYESRCRAIVSGMKGNPPNKQSWAETYVSVIAMFVVAFGSVGYFAWNILRVKARRIFPPRHRARRAASAGLLTIGRLHVLWATSSWHNK